MAAFEVVNGLHAIAELVEDNMMILDAREFPRVPLTLRVSVSSSAVVQGFADAVGVPVTTDVADDAVHSRAAVQRGLVELVVFHIGEPVRELARPVTVTPLLAEVEG